MNDYDPYRDYEESLHPNIHASDMAWETARRYSDEDIPSFLSRVLDAAISDEKFMETFCSVEELEKGKAEYFKHLS